MILILLLQHLYLRYYQNIFHYPHFLQFLHLNQVFSCHVEFAGFSCNRYHIYVRTHNHFHFPKEELQMFYLFRIHRLQPHLQYHLHLLPQCNQILFLYHGQYQLHEGVLLLVLLKNQNFVL